MSLTVAPKVMLVEDDPQFVYLIQRYARTSGCQMIHVDSAPQAMTLAQQERPDLILLDIGVSGTDGWQILQALKTDPITRKIRVFVCSASEVAMQGWEEHADGCLLKPVMYEDFLAALAEGKSYLTSDATR